MGVTEVIGIRGTRLCGKQLVEIDLSMHDGGDDEILLTPAEALELIESLVARYNETQPPAMGVVEVRRWAECEICNVYQSLPPDATLCPDCAIKEAEKASKP